MIGDREVEPDSPRGRAIQDAGAIFGCLTFVSVATGLLILVGSGVAVALGKDVQLWFLVGVLLLAIPLALWSLLLQQVRRINARQPDEALPQGERNKGAATAKPARTGDEGSGTIEPWERPGARVDVLIIETSRQEVENDDTNGALEKLNKLLVPETASRLKGRLFFLINGYDDDPRDLWEIPEARAWVRKLDIEWPYWFYFMDLGPQSTLPLVAFSVCRWERVEGGKTIPPDELKRFLIRHFTAMQELSRRLGESPEKNKARAAAINGFFFPE